MHVPCRGDENAIPYRNATGEVNVARRPRKDCALLSKFRGSPQLRIGQTQEGASPQTHGWKFHLLEPWSLLDYIHGIWTTTEGSHPLRAGVARSSATF